jgi:hypothetical protein
MYKKNLLYLSIAFLLCGWNGARAQKSIPDGFRPLLNGKDFAGWNISPDMGAWKMENSIAHCSGKPSVPYVILTVENFENFELYADFRMSAGCNSGIMLHQPDRGWGRESRIGMELQVSDDAGKDPNVYSCGAIYNVLPPIVNAVRPAGYWNTFHVTLDWPSLIVELNGHIVQNASLENHPALMHRLRSGHIGLQNHGREVEYRNIFIKELPPKEPAETSLFDGKSLEGWTAVGNAEWSVADGEITASGGDGFLVSNATVQPDSEIRVYAGRKETGGNSGVFYHWVNEGNTGYKSDFYDHSTAKTLQYMEHDRYLTQIIDHGSEAIVFLNGIEVQRNLYMIPAKDARVAIFHSGKDAGLKIARVSVKPISPLTSKSR